MVDLTFFDGTAVLAAAGSTVGLRFRFAMLCMCVMLSSRSWMVSRKSFQPRMIISAGIARSHDETHYIEYRGSLDNDDDDDDNPFSSVTSEAISRSLHSLGISARSNHVDIISYRIGAMYQRLFACRLTHALNTYAACLGQLLLCVCSL